MGAFRIVVTLVWIAGCLPPPAAPQQPQPQLQPAPPGPPVTAATPAQVQPSDPYAPPPQVVVQPPPPPVHYYVAEDGEVMANFAVVGALAAIDILVRQDITDGNADTLIAVAGVAGGAGIGYVLTQRFKVDSGAAHATTIGTMIGIANAALLIEPLGYDRASSVMGLLFAGSALGATGGFLYGESAHLTSGQSTMVGNMTFLGVATASLTAIAANRDGHYGGFEDATLALGLDGGAVIGALVAPHLDWSATRAKYVFATTFVGALVGGLVGGLVTKPSNGGASDANVEVTAGAMTAGLWGGFALGVVMTKDSAPDPSFAQPAVMHASAQAPTSMMPWIGDHGQVGVMTGGTF